MIRSFSDWILGLEHIELMWDKIKEDYPHHLCVHTSCPSMIRRNAMANGDFHSVDVFSVSATALPGGKCTRSTPSCRRRVRASCSAVCVNMCAASCWRPTLPKAASRFPVWISVCPNPKLQTLIKFLFAVKTFRHGLILSVVYDFCLTKRVVTDEVTGMSFLETQWATKSSCDQRKGALFHPLLFFGCTSFIFSRPELKMEWDGNSRPNFQFRKKKFFQKEFFPKKFFFKKFFPKIK